MTTRYRVGYSLIFVTDERDRIDFDAVVNRFYEELLSIEEREGDIIDPDLAASLADLTADVEMLVVAESFIDAQIRAICAGRTALHTIEIATPGWEATIAGITAPTVVEDELQDA